MKWEALLHTNVPATALLLKILKADIGPKQVTFMVLVNKALVIKRPLVALL